MIEQEVCPICKTALKDTKDKQVQCVTCKALISTDVEWQSQIRIRLGTGRCQNVIIVVSMITTTSKQIRRNVELVETLLDLK